MISIKRIIPVLMFATIFIVACTKESSDVRLDPNLATSKVSDITSTTVNINGYVIASEGITEKGICYDVNPSPTTASSKVIYAGESTKAIFTVSLTGLAFNTTYYAKAYAVTQGGTIYGEEITFKTLVNLPAVTLTEATNIGMYTATSGGEVTNAGGGVLSAKGVCWSTETNPTVNDSKSSDGTDLGVFTSNLTNLRGATLYYYRAYATNEAGTAYSEEMSFTTLASAPYVTTTTTQGFETSAKVGGEVTYDGGATITERGICYSTSANPTINDDKVTSAGTVGTFEVDITGLTSNTTYHVRAYATNANGTSYGEDKTFATYPAALYMTGNGVGLDAENWNWYEPLQLIPVHSHPELFWKIVWMKGSGEFKFAPQASWSGDFGKTGTATNGVYAKGGDNIPVPSTAGYYMVVVDLKNSTIEIAAPKVYGMGDVFGGWTTGVPANLFTVDNGNQVIKFDGVPNSGNLRMYVSASTLACDWWQAEFNVIGGALAFRGTGGDQAAVPVTAGQNVSLNFKLGTGSITTP